MTGSYLAVIELSEDCHRSCRFYVLQLPVVKKFNKSNGSENSTVHTALSGLLHRSLIQWLLHDHVTISVIINY